MNAAEVAQWAWNWIFNTALVLIVLIVSIEIVGRLGFWVAMRLRWRWSQATAHPPIDPDAIEDDDER